MIEPEKRTLINNLNNTLKLTVKYHDIKDIPEVAQIAEFCQVKAN